MAKVDEDQGGSKKTEVVIKKDPILNTKDDRAATV